MSQLLDFDLQKSFKINFTGNEIKILRLLLLDCHVLFMWNLYFVKFIWLFIKITIFDKNLQFALVYYNVLQLKKSI